MTKFGLHYLIPLIPLIAGLCAVLTSGAIRNLILVNMVLQATLFLVVAHIPTHRNRRMSYVDIAWPWGLVVIGLVALVACSPMNWRGFAMAAIYGTMGARMGIRSVKAVFRGAFKHEFPRYEYQKSRWRESRKNNELLAMQVDVAAQGMLNMAMLCLPAFLFTLRPSGVISPIEVAGLGVWAAAFALEWKSDRQKLIFGRKAEAAGDTNAVCDIGLWRYSRHPNYFFEWMVWNALIISSAPALAVIWHSDGAWPALLVGATLLFASLHMLHGILYGTGVEPAEFYSTKRRPGYGDYKRRTSQFWPRLPRERS